MKLTKAIISNFLSEETNKLMTISTNGSHPWIATVYYGFDDDLTLYFISDAGTMHARHIAENSQVALAIANSLQPAESKKAGLQLYGTATLIQDEAVVKKAIDFWKTNVGVTDEKLNHEAVKGRMYQIVPKKIKYFNQNLFEVEDGKEPILEL